MRGCQRASSTTRLSALTNLAGAAETYDWPSSSSSPVLRHSTKISTSSALREKRRFVLTASLRRDPQPNDYAMEITSTGRDPETWVVCNQLGGGKATDMATDPELSHMKLGERKLGQTQVNARQALRPNSKQRQQRLPHHPQCRGAVSPPVFLPPAPPPYPPPPALPTASSPSP